MGHQRVEVLLVERQDRVVPDRHGGHQPRRERVPGHVDVPGADRHAGRQHRAQRRRSCGEPLSEGIARAHPLRRRPGAGRRAARRRGPGVRHRADPPRRRAHPPRHAHHRPWRSKALDMMCERALSRDDAGQPAGRQAVRAGLHRRLLRRSSTQFRLFVLYTAWEIDKYNDYKRVRKDIAAVKVADADGAARHRLAGDAGARRARRHATRCRSPGMMHGAAVMGLADGPTEVHKVTVARQVLRDYKASDDLWPTRVDPRKMRGGQGEVRRATSSTRWGTCDRSRPRSRALDGRPGPAGQGRADRAPRSSPGGSQNEIYEIRRGDLHGALRIPPPTAPGQPRRRASCASGGSSRRSTAPTCRTRAAIARAATTRRARPHLLPDGLRRRLVADGPDRRKWPAPFDTDLDARQGLAYQLVEGIALLGKVDWQAKGLQDLGRPDGFHERQVDRWTALPRAHQGPRAPGLRRGVRLAARAPADRLHPRAHARRLPVRQRDVPRTARPARLAAIVDWEMGTVGDPKLDLGWVVQSWPDDTTAPAAATSGYVDMHGMPSRDEVLAHYAAGVGPPGRRHRLLRRPRQVEARRRARAGLPARRRRREAARVRPDRARPHAGRGRPRREHGVRAVSQPEQAELEPAEPELVVERRGAVLVVRLNRPQARNALTPALIAGLGRERRSAAEADPEIRAVVLTGTGDRAFCAGHGPARVRRRRGDRSADDADVAARSTGCSTGEVHDPSRRCRERAPPSPAVSSCCSAATSSSPRRRREVRAARGQAWPLPRRRRVVHRSAGSRWRRARADADRRQPSTRARATTLVWSTRSCRPATCSTPRSHYAERIAANGAARAGGDQGARAASRSSMPPAAEGSPSDCGRSCSAVRTPRRARPRSSRRRRSRSGRAAERARRGLPRPTARPRSCTIEDLPSPAARCRAGARARRRRRRQLPRRADRRRPVPDPRCRRRSCPGSEFAGVVLEEVADGVDTSRSATASSAPVIVGAFAEEIVRRRRA